MNKPGYNVFAGLFFVASFARGILLSVLPLQALAQLGHAQAVSVLFFCISISGMASSLSMFAVIRRVGIARAFYLGAAAMALSALLLGTPSPWLFAAGLICHMFAIAAMEVSLSLHVLHLIPRRELTRFEPKRVLFVVIALTIGPLLGVYLESRIEHWLPFAMTILTSAAAILYFRWLGLHDVKMPATLSGTTNPLRHVRRYFTQPRLRLAWGLTLARGAWWTMFLIYTPIYATQAGLGDLAGAGIVSIGSAWTLTLPFWGWVGRRYGLRRLLVGGFCTTALVSASVFVFSANPKLASVLLVFAALGATMLDGAGYVLFFRAVRSWERSEMTGVFLTCRDASQLAPPGVFAVLLKFFALPIVFAGAAVWMLTAALFCRHIPRRM